MRFNRAGEAICQNYHPDYLQNLASALGYNNYQINVADTGNYCTLVWLDESGGLDSSEGDAQMEEPYDVIFYN